MPSWGCLPNARDTGTSSAAAFEALAGGEENWDLKPAQVYATLDRMERAGLVAESAIEQDGGPEKRIYEITPAGGMFLQEWFTQASSPEHQRDEFFLKLMVALVSGATDPYRLINMQRTFLYRQLHAITSQRTRSDPNREMAKILLLEKAAMHLEADLRWLDITEVRLDAIKRQPLPEPGARPRGRPKKAQP